MGNPSIDELLAWMQDKSKTCGWGALIAYDRRKTNDLLQQLYIERFTSGHYLPLVNESMDFDKTIEHLSDLKFSVPLMSFDNASLSDSKVKLSLDFVGGMIVTEEKGLGISKVQKVLPLNRPQLTMTQPLARVPGLVDEDGQVALDLANKEGSEFKATFMLGSLDQIEMGRRFQAYFEEKLTDEQRIFPIGTLAGEANDALTPAGFIIRTMAAPGAKVRGAPNEGDGAVLVFARMKNRSDGQGPPMDFLYPIPADADGKVYTGTMWLSSATLLEDLLRPQALKDIGHDIDFAPYEGQSDVAWALTATQGGKAYLNLEIEIDIDEGNTQAVYIRSTWQHWFDASGPDNQPLTIAAKDDELELSWETAYESYYAYKRRRSGVYDSYKEGDLQNTASMTIRLAPVLDAKGVVHFEETLRRKTLSFLCDQYLLYLTDSTHYCNAVLGDRLSDYMFDALDDILKDFSAPSIETFLISNLLFPGHNALQLSDAHLPGDLALFGHIDPLLTSATATPRHATLEAGGSQQFSLGAGVSAVTWEVRGTDPDDDEIGTIDASGLYRAPAAGPLFKGYLVAVVTGHGTLDGQEVRSSAMVTVLASAVAANPVFEVCLAGGNVELSAETIAGEPLWSLKDPSLGGSLSTTSGSACTYTAGPLDSSRNPVYVDTVVVANEGDNGSSECLVLVRNTYLLMDVVISKDSIPSSGEVRLQIMEKGIAYNPDEYGATCRILVGGGSISEDGVYKQAADASGFAVVLLEVDDFMGTLAGYMVLPLPLDKYEEVILRVGDSLRLAAEQKASGD
ncbi:hypothetical protein ACX3YG_18265 [Pseudomonas wadenswilerensis]